MVAKSKARKKPAPRARTTIKLRVDILEMLKTAAAYHNVGYHTYMQWILENGLKAEARYYGWAMPGKKYVVRQGVPTERQAETLRRLLRISTRRAKKAGF